MQLNQLWRNQAQMALSNRRFNLNASGKTKSFDKNYKSEDIKDTLANYSETDNQAMGLIGEKVFARQRAARKRVQQLNIALPNHGTLLEFYRDFQVEQNKPLMVSMHTEKAVQKIEEPPMWNNYLMIILCACTGLMIFGNRRLF